MLLLFDIDGTLLHAATDAHRDAMHEALRVVHGVNVAKVPVTLSPAGRTDPEIARAILLAAGVSARRIDERASDVQDECCRAYVRLCPPDLSHTVLPGIADLLDWLAGLDQVVLGLLTGNYEAVARLKLARAGLGRYFPSGQGAFGSDAEDRAALPAIARRRAGRVGAPQPRQETLIIGDTPRDIACAAADGVRCLAVTTGPFEAEDLGGAEAVASDGAALRSALEGVLVTPSVEGTGSA